MTSKNNEDLLNIYDNKDSDDFFSIDNDPKSDNKILDESTMKLDDISSNSKKIENSDNVNID